MRFLYHFRIQPTLWAYHTFLKPITFYPTTAHWSQITEKGAVLLLTAEPFTPSSRANSRGIYRIIAKPLFDRSKLAFCSAGLPGRECLLRSICETSKYPLEQNGILGDVIRVIFSWVVFFSFSRKNVKSPLRENFFFQTVEFGEGRGHHGGGNFRSRN